jgi:hypothetical protein
MEQLAHVVENRDEYSAPDVVWKRLDKLIVDLHKKTTRPIDDAKMRELIKPELARAKNLLKYIHVKKKFFLLVQVRRRTGIKIEDEKAKKQKDSQPLSKPESAIFHHAKQLAAELRKQYKDIKIYTVTDFEYTPNLKSVAQYFKQSQPFDVITFFEPSAFGGDKSVRVMDKRQYDDLNNYFPEKNIRVVTFLPCREVSTAGWPDNWYLNCVAAINNEVGEEKSTVREEIPTQKVNSLEEFASVVFAGRNILYININQNAHLYSDRISMDINHRAVSILDMDLIRAYTAFGWFKDILIACPLKGDQKAVDFRTLNVILEAVQYHRREKYLLILGHDIDVKPRLNVVQIRLAPGEQLVDFPPPTLKSRTYTPRMHARIVKKLHRAPSGYNMYFSSWWNNN